MMSLIDPSLARGIRRAYLESLDQTWSRFISLRKRSKLRQPYLQVKNVKGFDKNVEKLRRDAEIASLMSSEITVRTKHRCLWASLFLTREVDSHSEYRNGMTPTGHARVRALSSTYPADEWVAPLSIRVTAHAIDRLIQRTGIVDLPLRERDIRLVNIELSQSLLWAVAAFFILGKIKIDEGSELTLILPSQNGFFIGKLSSNPIELSLVTYVNRESKWQEQQEAFRILDSISETDLALFASEVLARNHMNIQHSAVDQAIYQCWRDYGWRIREKLDRPSLLNECWNGRQMHATAH